MLLHHVKIHYCTMYTHRFPTCRDIAPCPNILVRQRCVPEIIPFHDIIHLCCTLCHLCLLTMLCVVVFGMLLGDTIILDNLIYANAYRQEVGASRFFPQVTKCFGVGSPVYLIHFDFSKAFKSHIKVATNKYEWTIVFKMPCTCRQQILPVLTHMNRHASI